MAQFCPTFDMLLSGPNNTKKYHKTFSCIFLRLAHKSYILTLLVGIFFCEGQVCISVSAAANKTSYEFV